MLYVSCECKVRPSTFGCVAMGSAVFFILRSSLLLYSAGSGENQVKGWIKCVIVQTKTLCRYGFYVFLGCTRACCIDVIGNVICVDQSWP